MSILRACSHALALAPCHEGVARHLDTSFRSCVHGACLPFRRCSLADVENNHSAPTNPEGWRTDSWQPSHVMADHENTVTSVAVCSLAMETFASSSLDHTIKLWSLSAADQASACVSTLHGSLRYGECVACGVRHRHVRSAAAAVPCVGITEWRCWSRCWGSRVFRTLLSCMECGLQPAGPPHAV